MELGPEDVSLLERCPHFRGWYVQASMELGPEDVSLLERCPHFRGWYVQASMELGPEDVSLLERCPHFRGWYVQASMELGRVSLHYRDLSSSASSSALLCVSLPTATLPSFPLPLLCCLGTFLHIADVYTYNVKVS